MRPPLSQVVVLVSHLQRPRQRSRLASLVAGLAAGYPDVHIEVLDTSVSESPANRPRSRTARQGRRVRLCWRHCRLPA
ncbi:hypothetical protein P4237_33040 [Pseudomonas aeruginosa]|nr:hypothetical protein [Pseudomonas aeruginosa]MDF5826807.1 hypothetical protein [Pseudomonas aeruginosa]